MSDADDNILYGFTSESNILINELLEKLEAIEEMDDDQKSKEKKSSLLADCGNQVDRIMGGAQSIAMALPENKTLILIGDMAQLCKAVSYRASKVSNNSSLVKTAVALLLDVTEILQNAIHALESETPEGQVTFTPAFVERLRWFSSQFAQGISGTVDSKTKTGAPSLGQSDIDDLLKKLGF
ncbi:MAG: hypothetical protein AABY64_08900 [Bdellovibrionota bacterium]